MKPLQIAALGYLLTALYVRLGGWDVVPDSLGWVLVCLGLARLPATVPHRALALGASALAGLVSLPLAVPALAGPVADADPALGWAASLPAFAAAAALAHALTTAARDGDDPVAAGWLGSLRSLVVVVALLPAVVLGAGVDALRPLATALAPLTVLGLAIVLLVHATRPWADDGTAVPR